MFGYPNKLDFHRSQKMSINKNGSYCFRISTNWEPQLRGKHPSNRAFTRPAAKHDIRPSSKHEKLEHDNAREQTQMQQTPYRHRPTEGSPFMY